MQSCEALQVQDCIAIKGGGGASSGLIQVDWEYRPYCNWYAVYYKLRIPVGRYVVGLHEFPALPE